MKITISGLGGTGKGVTSNLLKEKLKYKVLSSGDFFREIAREKKVSVYEFEKIVKNDKKIDLKIDKRQKEFGEKNDNFIFDSRLGFYFIPDSYKIQLTCQEEERIKRIKKRDGGKIEDIILKEKERFEISKSRYKKLYNIDDFTNKDNFDLIIDTTNRKPEEVVEVILENIKK